MEDLSMDELYHTWDLLNKIYSLDRPVSYNYCIFESIY